MGTIRTLRIFQSLKEIYGSKLDLLVRVRYANPLPAPPCPPKLLNIPTNPIRYASPQFLNNLTINTPLPMIVDAECGMPLDLGRWECLWEENADDKGETVLIAASMSFLIRFVFEALNPDAENLPAIDPKDRLFIGDPSTPAPSTNGGHSGPSSVPSTPATTQVPWLRKTEYISREGSQRSSAQEAYVFASSCRRIGIVIYFITESRRYPMLWMFLEAPRYATLKLLSPHAMIHSPPCLFVTLTGLT